MYRNGACTLYFHAQIPTVWYQSEASVRTRCDSFANGRTLGYRPEGRQTSAVSSPSSPFFLCHGRGRSPHKISRAPRRRMFAAPLRSRLMVAAGGKGVAAVEESEGSVCEWREVGAKPHWGHQYLRDPTGPTLFISPAHLKHSLELRNSSTRTTRTPGMRDRAATIGTRPAGA